MTESEEEACERLLDAMLIEVANEYRHLLPREALEEIQEALGDLIFADPNGRALVLAMLRGRTPAASSE